MGVHPCYAGAVMASVEFSSFPKVAAIRRRGPSSFLVTRFGLLWPVTAALLAAGSVAPEANTDMLIAVGRGLVALLPAVVVGAPMYLDGYAALPFVRGLMDMGMSFGAALGLMISGVAVSLYASVAVAAVVRVRVFVLYVAPAMGGACAAGYAANWLTG